MYLIVRTEDRSTRPRLESRHSFFYSPVFFLTTSQWKLLSRWVENLSIILLGRYAATHRSHAVDERPSGQRSGAVDGLAVVLGSPRSTVNVDVVDVQTQSAGFDRVVHGAVQHSDACAVGKDI